MIQAELHLSRNTDPLSSALAGESLVASGKHQRDAEVCLFFLQKRAGVTARELAYDMALAKGDTEEFWYAVTHKRLPDLRKRGLARNGDLRKCRRGHRLAQVWFST